MNLVGNIINGYMFLGVLGSGQYGVVYKVEKDGNVYAAKLFYEHVLLKEFKDENNRITREVEVLKRANSKYLVKYYDDFMIKNEAGIRAYFIIMELCEGDSLTDYLKRNNLSLDEKVNLFKEILVGINDLHHSTEEGILHRDIKPDNIIIKNDNSVKIVDYGFAKMIDFTSITNTGDQIGSPIFMSPEQFRDSKHIDPRADIYSLGVVFYYMLTSNYPYEANTIEELIYKLNSMPITPPTRYNKEIPHKYEKIIYRLLAKKLHLRYQKIEKILEDIENNAIEEFTFENYFYPWCINEKTVIQNYLKEKTDIKVIFPIHMKTSQQTLYSMVCSNDLRAIVDPSTHRLSYDIFNNVGGLKSLKYAPTEGIITLDNLRDISFRTKYISDWYDEMKNFEEIILPYQYISNSNYTKDCLEGWVQSGIQLINEACNFIYDKGSNQKKYAMIALDINHLVYDKDMILSYYSSIETDGIFVQVSGIKTINKLQLGVYVNFIKELQLATNTRVIALKVPVPIGLYLLSLGIHGFSCGISALEYFDEEFINKDRKAFNIYAKYYFKELLTLATYSRSEAYQLSPAYNYLEKCNCPYCKGRNFTDIAAEKNQTISLHFLHCLCEEIEILNGIIDPDEKIAYYKSRIEIAINKFNDLIKSGGLKKNDQYDLLQIIYSNM